jgi:hypothetical protein
MKKSLKISGCIWNLISILPLVEHTLWLTLTIIIWQERMHCATDFMILMEKKSTKI